VQGRAQGRGEIMWLDGTITAGSQSPAPGLHCGCLLQRKSTVAIQPRCNLRNKSRVAPSPRYESDCIARRTYVRSCLYECLRRHLRGVEATVAQMRAVSRTCNAIIILTAAQHARCPNQMRSSKRRPKSKTPQLAASGRMAMRRVLMQP
jgi:hypothetical protein